MRNGWWLGVVMVVSLASSVAVGQSGPRMVDESELFVRLWSSSPETGYVVRVDATVYGVGSNQDAVRVDVIQRGRTIATRRCSLSLRGSVGRLECEVGGDAPLTASGDLTVDLVYVDDVAESTETIRTLQLRVNAYPYWVSGDGSRQIMGRSWQIDGSDQLGTAFVYMQNSSLAQTEANQPQHISFYTSFSGAYSSGSAPVLRCTVNGATRIPDLNASWSPISDYEVQERTSQTADIRTIRWYRARIETYEIFWGRRIPSAVAGLDTTGLQFLGDNPGQWSCDFRQSGRVLRTFRFVVDADGRIAPHTEEAGPGAMRLIPGLHLVDVRLPHPNPIDAVVDPAAIRRASQYGRPWSNPDGVREMLGALPPASGSVAPSRAAGGSAGVRGRRGR